MRRCLLFSNHVGKKEPRVLMPFMAHKQVSLNASAYCSREVCGLVWSSTMLRQRASVIIALGISTLCDVKECVGCISTCVHGGR